MSDLSIVFLDAASDGNYKILVGTFNKVVGGETQKRDILLTSDGDDNTALHFGAKNGNVRICNFII